MNTLPVWISALRPKTLSAGASPVLLGICLASAEGKIAPHISLCLLLTALSIQITTNLANDYFDGIKGADTPLRKGPTRVTSSGLVSLCSMRVAIVLAIACTICCSIPLLIQGGAIVISLVALALLLAISYTAGPFPLSYLGLGDLFVLLFFGPIATASSFFLLRGYHSWQAAVWGLVPGLLSTAILCVNNTRDEKEDRLSGKKTLVVRLGKRFAIGEYTTCLALALLLPFCLCHTPHHPYLSLLSLPLALMCLHDFIQGNAYNKLLAKTGLLTLLHSGICSLCILL